MKHLPTCPPCNGTCVTGRGCNAFEQHPEDNPGGLIFRLIIAVAIVAALAGIVAGMMP